MLKTLLEILKDRSGGPALGILSTIVSVVSGVAGLFGKKDKTPPSPTVISAALEATGAPKPSEPQVRQATDRARRRRASAVGRKATILTSPLGLTGDDDIARPSLLGR